MYTSGLSLQRTPEEKADRFLFWQRSDKAFFAAGACHILAYLFVELHPNENYELIHIKPKDNFSGNHVYVTDGKWAFDFNGWTLEEELLRVTEQEYSHKYKGWAFERIVIKDDLEDFCKKNKHRLPYQYAYLPWERAYNYIKQFTKT
jgi:hypothetical protein